MLLERPPVSVLVFAALCASIGAAGCATEVIPEAQGGRLTAPALRQGGVLPAAPFEPPPPRLVPVADACRGTHLTFDRDTIASCACDERQYVRYDGKWMMRGALGCGASHPKEVALADVEVIVERSTLAPGEDARIQLVVVNPSDEALLLRLPSTRIEARIELPNGQRPADAVGSGNAASDHEALVELAPRGTLTLKVTATGSYDRWLDGGKSTDSSPFPPGEYRVRITTGLPKYYYAPIQIRS